VPGAPRVGDTLPCLVSAPHSVHRGPDRTTGPRHHGTSPWVLPLRNNSKFDKFHKFCVKHPKLVLNCAAVPVCLEKLLQGRLVLKSNYEYILNHSKPSKISHKSLYNSQTPQEPLFFAPRPSNHSKNSRITPEPVEKTVLPLKLLEHISFDPKLQFP
jgi:hypothetical protein